MREVTMTFAQLIILGLTKHTPLHSALTSRFLAEYVARMLDVGFEPCPALDPQRDPPVVWLLQMRAALPSTMRVPAHEGFDILRGLLREEEPYEARVPLSAVVGVTASKGGTLMSLDTLPETMLLSNGETYGPLNDEQMARLEAAVMREFSWSTRGGMFHLDLQKWNGDYVAGNTGASRRFALWRRLSRGALSPVYLKAKVMPYDIDAEALHALRDKFRLIYCYDNGLLGQFRRAEEIMPHSFAACGGLSHASRFFLVPYVHCVPSGLTGLMRRLHRKIDEDGALDLGRFLTEQISVALRRSPRSPGQRTTSRAGRASQE
jgi:hypothetical protein